MRVLVIVVLLIPLSNAEPADILHNNVLYAEGTQVKASRRDTVISRDALRVYTEQRPNALIHGYVTAGGLSRDLRFLNIRCAVKTGSETLRLVLVRLSVEMDEPSTFSSRRLKSFNVAITDTIPSNETRTYLFKQHLDTITDEGARILWNYYRLSSNPQSFGWTFTPMYVWRLQTY